MAFRYTVLQLFVTVMNEFGVSGPDECVVTCYDPLNSAVSLELHTVLLEISNM